MSAAEHHLSCTTPAGFKYLAAALDVARSEVCRLIRGPMARLGLLEHQYGNLSVDSELDELLLDPLRDTIRTGLYRTGPSESLGLDVHELDPGVVEHSLSLIRNTTEKPVHLVLHGPAGAGKTTFARRLAQESGRPVLEVPPHEDDRTTTRRLGLVACLRLNSGGEGVTVIVDEADALLETATAWSRRGNRQDKAWLNEVLETPSSRVIWVTNSTKGIEPSTLRRFTYSIRFRPFGRRQRVRLWDRVLRRHRIKRFFNARDIEALARRYEVSAGTVDLAVGTAATVATPKRSTVYQSVTRALDAHITLTTGQEVRPDRESVDSDYSLDGLNVSGDIDRLIARLEAFNHSLRDPVKTKRHSLNILFAGPPGTGKSELARHLADRLDRKLMVTRSSDLLSPWVGMTEQHIAATFKKAEREEAVLVIDEVDTMLFSRTAAERSWEVSRTNELLTQMERFRGVLIATTNRFEALDEASMRRFGEKLRFDFLTPDGNLIFYRKMLAPIAKGRLDDVSIRCLQGISVLAPGDFKVVRDRWTFAVESPTHSDLVRDLEAEAKIKQSQQREKRVGF